MSCIYTNAGSAWTWAQVPPGALRWHPHAPIFSCRVELARLKLVETRECECFATSENGLYLTESCGAEYGAPLMMADIFPSIMYICMCIYACVWVYVCMWRYVYVCMCTCMDVCRRRRPSSSSVIDRPSPIVRRRSSVADRPVPMMFFYV